jgi:hypothetical protein
MENKIKMFVMEESEGPRLYKSRKNPFFLEDPFETTAHKRHRNVSLVQLVLWATLEYEEGRRVAESSPFNCNFYLVDTCERGFDADMSSYTQLQTTEMQQPHLELIPSK